MLLILFAGHEQQRHFDAVGEHNRGMRDVFLRLLPQGSVDAILAFFECVDASARASAGVKVARELSVSSMLDCLNSNIRPA